MEQLPASIGTMGYGGDSTSMKTTKTDDEPSPKKRKESDCDKLETRLSGILCCAVCLDLPKTAIYQCASGHLMCAGCLTHLLADARIRDESASCPTCRTSINKELCSRNLAAEKAVSELPARCKYCSKEFPRSQLENHQALFCEDRESSCTYSCIGCVWRGPSHEKSNHEKDCPHPLKCGSDVMNALDLVIHQRTAESLLHSQIYQLLSYESISFNDLQFKPYRSVEYRLYYETSRFVTFSNQWVVKACINDNQKDPTQSCKRNLSYQLILKSKPTRPVALYYLILKGPFGDMKVYPKIYWFEFVEGKAESSYQLLPLCDSAECNKLLAAKVINFRLIMFEVTK